MLNIANVVAQCIAQGDRQWTIEKGSSSVKREREYRPDARREEHDVQRVSVDMLVDGVSATPSSAEKSDTSTTNGYRNGRER